MASGEKIRVLIVDDISETRENIRKLLQFDADVEVVGAARTGKEAVDLSVELKPDVVLMDINMPDMDGIAATEAIRKKGAFTQIVILSVQNDPNYMRRAMLAGARDFLTKPPMIDELTTAIHTAGTMAHEEKAKLSSAASQSGGGGAHLQPLLPSKLGKVVVVYNPKGGIGSTTIAINLAISLNTEATKVALVDGNLQYGDVAVFLNEQGKNSILDVASMADELDIEMLNEVMLNHAASGLKVLAAPPKLEVVDKISGDQFGKVVQFLRQVFAYVIIDTSSYLSPVVLSAMDIADVIILLTSQEIPSIKSCKSFLTLADEAHISRKRIIFVMNKLDKRIAISPERVAESLKQEIVAVIPLDEKIVINSVNRGIPFILDNKILPIGKSILSLAELVQDRIAKLETEAVPQK